MGLNVVCKGVSPNFNEKLWRVDLGAASTSFRPQRAKSSRERIRPHLREQVLTGAMTERRHYFIQSLGPYWAAILSARYFDPNYPNCAGSAIDLAGESRSRAHSCERHRQWRPSAVILAYLSGIC